MTHGLRGSALLILLPCCALVLFAVLFKNLMIGEYYWDIQLYETASYRFRSGMLPSLDYFSHIGIGSLWVFHLARSVLPDGHPIWIGQLGTILFLSPLVLAGLVRNTPAAPGQRLVAVLFLFYAMMPYNFSVANSHSPDGYGLYNRQSNLIVFLVNCMIVWKPRPVVLISGLFYALLAAALVKANAFVMVSCVAGLAAVLRLLSWRVLAASVSALLVTLVAVDLHDGYVTSYLVDLHTLYALNREVVSVRVLQFVGQQVDTIAILVALCSLLLYVMRVQTPYRRSYYASVCGLVAAELVCGIAYESQNSGSIEFCYLAPLLIFLERERSRDGKLRSDALLAMVAFLLIAPVAAIGKRAVRSTVVATIDGVPLSSGDWTLGHAMVRRNQLDQAVAISAGAVSWPAADWPTREDFQASYVVGVVAAQSAALTYETTHDIVVRSAFTLDFVDPFPQLLSAMPARGVSLALDPGRTFAPVTAADLDRLAAVDALFVPKCPLFPLRQAIRSAYQSLSGPRQVVELTPCWEMWLRVE